MEWSGLRQLGVALKSVVPGCYIGFMLDVSTGFWRGKKYRHKIFLADIICCILAAVITFFGALVITDGQFHPVLFVGILIGLLVEHFVVGRWLSYLFCKLHKLLRILASRTAHIYAIFGRLLGSVVGNKCLKRDLRQKSRKNSDKI